MGENETAIEVPANDAKRKEKKKDKKAKKHKKSKKPKKEKRRQRNEGGEGEASLDRQRITMSKGEDETNSIDQMNFHGKSQNESGNNRPADEVKVAAESVSDDAGANAESVTVNEESQALGKVKTSSSALMAKSQPMDDGSSEVFADSSDEDSLGDLSARNEHDSMSSRGYPDRTMSSTNAALSKPLVGDADPEVIWADEELDLDKAGRGASRQMPLGGEASIIDAGEPGRCEMRNEDTILDSFEEEEKAFADDSDSDGDVSSRNPNDSFSSWSSPRRGVIATDEALSSAFSDDGEEEVVWADDEVIVGESLTSGALGKESSVTLQKAETRHMDSPREVNKEDKSAPSDYNDSKKKPKKDKKKSKTKKDKDKKKKRRSRRVDENSAAAAVTTQPTDDEIRVFPGNTAPSTPPRTPKSPDAILKAKSLMEGRVYSLNSSFDVEKDEVGGDFSVAKVASEEFEGGKDTTEQKDHSLKKAAMCSDDDAVFACGLAVVPDAEEIEGIAVHESQSLYSELLQSKAVQDDSVAFPTVTSLAARSSVSSLGRSEIEVPLASAELMLEDRSEDMVSHAMDSDSPVSLERPMETGKTVSKRWPEYVGRSSRRCLILSIITATIIITAAATGIAIALASKGPTPVEPTLPPSDARRSERLVAIEEAIRQHFGPNSPLDDPSSAQARSARWLAEEDPLLTFPLVTVKEVIRFKQRYALAVFAYSTSVEQWTNATGWLEPTEECTWPGLICDEEDRVVKFTTDIARERNMEGTIPVEVVGLTYLESFGITKNPGVKGTIPTEFAGIEPLERLLFRDCSMTGQIPEQFNGKFNLNALYLDGNYLVGKVPSLVGELPALEFLYLYGNQLTGRIPETLLTSTSLKAISVRGNQLTGPIPDPGNQTGVWVRLVLATNYLSGTIPEGFGYKTTIKDLSLFDLPGLVGFGKLSELRSMKLSNTSLTGTMPEAVCSLRNTSGGPLTNLTADCGELECPCCTYCF